MKDVYPYCFFQGKIVSIEDAKISIMTNALQYGTGIFAGIRVYHNKEKGFFSIFRIWDHYKRFLSSLKILGVKSPYTQEEFVKHTIDLVRKNKPTGDAYLRPFAYVGHTKLGPNLADTTMDFAMYMLTLGEYLPVDKGLSVLVSSWRRVSDNAIPARGKITGSYINSALARKEAHELGFNEALVLTESGHVAEGSAENIFLVRDGVLITPSVSDDALEGITRKTIVKFAEDMGIPTESRSIDRSELYIADEAFFSGTGVQVSWIAKIDNRVIGDGKRGPITAKLQEKYFNVVKGNDPKYKDWLTKV